MKPIGFSENNGSKEIAESDQMIKEIKEAISEARGQIEKDKELLSAYIQMQEIAESGGIKQADPEIIKRIEQRIAQEEETVIRMERLLDDSQRMKGNLLSQQIRINLLLLKEEFPKPVD